LGLAERLPAIHGRDYSITLGAQDTVSQKHKIFSPVIRDQDLLAAHLSPIQHDQEVSAYSMAMEV
jgi:hypothetical protein